MGWLGWTEAATLRHTPQAIQAAKAGRVEMINAVLRSIFGTGSGSVTTLAGKRLGVDDGGPAPSRAPTAENFRAMFGALRGDP